MSERATEGRASGIRAVSDALATLGSKCNRCKEDASMEEADRQAWVHVRSTGRKKKSAQILGFPLGSTLWVDGIKVEPVQRFTTATCPSCATAIAEVAERDIARQNADQRADRERNAKTAARVAIVLTVLSAIALAIYGNLGLGDEWEPLFWGAVGVPVVSIIVWAALKFDEPLDHSVGEETTKRADAVHDSAISAILAPTAPGVEVLRDDTPESLEAEHYVLSEFVFAQGEKSGWTLFNCWEIFDEPGGTRRQDVATAGIRDGDRLRADIGDWLESSGK